MHDRNELFWKRDGVNWNLHRYGSKAVLARVVPDAVYVGMYRVRQNTGELSDMVNLTRARDAAGAIIVALLNSRERTGGWPPIDLNAPPVSQPAPDDLNRSLVA